jgi:hypothetical protein
LATLLNTGFISILKNHIFNQIFVDNAENNGYNHRRLCGD